MTYLNFFHKVFFVWDKENLTIKGLVFGIIKIGTHVASRYNLTENMRQCIPDGQKGKSARVPN